MPHIRVSQSGQHLIRKWLVACSAPSNYMDLCWRIVNWTLRNKLQRKLNKRLYMKCVWIVWGNGDHVVNWEGGGWGGGDEFNWYMTNGKPVCLDRFWDNELHIVSFTILICQKRISLSGHILIIIQCCIRKAMVLRTIPSSWHFNHQKTIGLYGRGSWRVPVSHRWAALSWR